MRQTKVIFFLLFTISLQVNSQEINWIKKADLPIPISKAKAAVINEKIYIVGGITPSFRGFNNANYEYNEESDTWIKKANIPTGRTNYAIASVGNKLYVIGGDPMLNKVEVFNPTINTWDSVCNMPTKRQHVSCAVVEDKIYVIGGFENVCCPPYPERCNWDECAKISDKNEVYDPKTDSWKSLSPLPTARHGLDMVSVNGKIYVIGGMGDESSLWTPLDIVEVYDPETDTWDEAQKMPIPRDGYGYTVQNDKIYIFGGWIADKVQTNTTVVYDTKTDLWTNSTDLPIKTGACAYATIGNKIYLFGGDKEDYTKIYSTTFVGEIVEK